MYQEKRLDDSSNCCPTAESDAHLLPPIERTSECVQTVTAHPFLLFSPVNSRQPVGENVFAGVATTTCFILVDDESIIVTIWEPKEKKKERARDSHLFSTLPSDNTRLLHLCLSSQHVLFLPHSQEKSLSTDSSQPQMFRQIQYPLKATNE